MVEEIVFYLVVAQALVDLLVLFLLIGVLCEVDKANMAIAALKPQDEINSSSTAGDGRDHVAPSDGAPASVEGERAGGLDEAAPAVTSDVRVSVSRKGSRPGGACRVTGQPRRTCRCPRCLGRS